MQEIEWHCQNCGLQAILSSLEKIQHQNICVIANEISGDDNRESKNVTHKSNSQAYECSHCSQTLYLTPIEILKHKKQHIKGS